MAEISRLMKIQWRRFGTSAMAVVMLAAPLSAVASVTLEPNAGASIAGGVSGSLIGIQPAELFTGANPLENCQTCQPMDPAKSAEPTSIQPTYPVNPATGDYSTGTSLFSYQDTLGGFGESLTYDASLAQAQQELANLGSAPVGFGWGWNDSLFTSLSAPSGGTAGQIQVNEPGGSAVYFTADGSTTSSSPNNCQMGSFDNPLKYTVMSVPGETNSDQWYCAANRVDAQLSYHAATQSYSVLTRGQKQVVNYDMYGFPVSRSSPQIDNSALASPPVIYTFGLSPGGAYGFCPTNINPTPTDTSQNPVWAVSSCIQVTDDAGRVVMLMWSNFGHIIGISYPTPVGYETAHLGYSGTSEMTSLSVPDGTTSNTFSTTYTYNSSVSCSMPTGQICPYDAEMLSKSDPMSRTTSMTWTNPASFSLSSMNTGHVASLVAPTSETTTFSYNHGNCGACTATSQTTEVTYATGERDWDNYQLGRLVLYTSGPKSKLTTPDPCTSDVCREAIVNWTEPGGTPLGASSPIPQDGNAVVALSIALPGTLGDEVETAKLDSTGNQISVTFPSPSGTGTLTQRNYFRNGQDWATCGSTTCPEASLNHKDNLDELCWRTLPVATPPSGTSCTSSGSAFSSVTTYETYDTSGNLLTTTDPLGEVTTNAYWSTGLRCWSAPPTSAGLVGSSPSCADAFIASGVSSWTYDSYGEVISSYGGASSSPGQVQHSTNAYLSTLLGGDVALASSTDVMGATTSYSYAVDSTDSAKANGRLVSTTSPGGITTSYAYDADGETVETATTAGTLATYQLAFFDGDGRLCWSEGSSTSADLRAHCNATLTQPHRSFSYLLDTSAPTQEISAAGAYQDFAYSDLLNPTMVTSTYVPTTVTPPTTAQAQSDPSGLAASQHATYTRYDRLGRACATGPILATSCAVQSGTGDTWTSYDLMGNSSQITDPMGQVTTMAATDARFPSVITTLTTPEQGTSTISLDAPGQVTAKTSGAIGSSAPLDTLSFAYDQNGNQCLIEPAAASLTSSNCPTSLSGIAAGWTGEIHDAVGRVSSAGNQATFESTTYRADGLPTQVAETATLGTTSSSNTTSYSYNNFNLVSCVGYAAGSNCANAGSSTNLVVNRGYDALGDLTSTTDWLGNTVTYGYDLSSGTPQPSTTTVPTALGAATTETQTLQHNADGQITSIAYAGTASLSSLNSLSDSYSYATSSNLSSLNSSSAVAGTSSSPTYTQRAQVQSATNQGASSADSFTYGANNRLATETLPASASLPTSYTYSSSTESLSSSSPASGSSTYYAYDALGERCAKVTAATNPSLGCTSTPTGSTTYAWTSLGQLAQVTTPSATSTYGYDARGLRVMTASTTTSGTTTAMSGYDTVDGGSIPEMLSDGTNSYVYGPVVMGGAAPVEQIQGTSTSPSFCFSTPSGVQAVVTQTAGSTAAAVAEMASYSITGVRSVSATTAVVTPFGFQGAYQDATGLDYLYNRYFDPSSAQFLSVDPRLLTTHDPFGLDGGDTLNASDPLGLQGWYCMQGTNHYYQGNLYGLIGPGQCGFGQFGQYCFMADVACYKSAFFGDEGQAVAFDKLMVELASIRSEASPPPGEPSAPSNSTPGGTPSSSSGGWLHQVAAAIGRSLEQSENISSCVYGIREFWTSDGGTKLALGEATLVAAGIVVPFLGEADLAQAAVVLGGGSMVGCGFGLAGMSPP